MGYTEPIWIKTKLVLSSLVQEIMRNLIETLRVISEISQSDITTVVPLYAQCCLCSWRK